MGTRLKEAFFLLAVCALAFSDKPIKKESKEGTKDGDNSLYQYEEYDAADEQEVLFNEDRPCPRDCICTVSQGYRIAKCNRLEVGTQKFGDDVTDLVIENADPSLPIQLDDFIFKRLGLHQIATVKIVNSTISSIAPNAFHGLHELYAVNLSNNKLKSLHPETFATNKKLLLLTMSNNPLKFPAKGSEEYFLNTSSVQELDVSYCNMQYITANTFKNMPGLMYLNVAGNELSDMDSDTFKKLFDLEELDLSDNNIKSLPDEIFSENTELATLHIQRNPIDTVYGLKISDLLTLNAGQTNIKFVGPSMFNGMTYTANLNLSGNSIEKIHNQAFHKLVELNYLDLSYNNLDLISSSLIKENIELDIFKISNNPNLKHLPEEGFNCSAGQFNIYLFDASNCGLEEIYDDSLKTFTALSQINLSHNNIKSVSNKVFMRCPKLVEINLSYNLLVTLDTKMFDKNIELGKLNLQGNPLKTFSAELFLHTPLITLLDISNTEITSLWKTNKNITATILSNLSYLNVSNARITEIQKKELDNLTKLNVLDVKNNPLACSRNFEDLMSWLNKRNVSPSANSASIANLASNAKEDVGYYTWEELANKTCGTSIPVADSEPLPAVSDEEIWERIDKDADGNFDLKNTLDDAKLSENNKDKSTNIDSKNDDLLDDDDDAQLDDDKDDEADDEEGDDDADEEEDDAAEDYDDGDDEIDLKVKLNDKPLLKVPSLKANKLPKDKIMDVRVIEKETIFEDVREAVTVEASILGGDHGRYDYLWPMLICLLGTLLMIIVMAKVVMIMCNRRNKQIRYNSAIIAAMSNQSRTKKDCGLVYQQLSEDLTGPTTPKLNRYAPLHSVTVNADLYESSTYNKIVPEAV